MTLTQSILTIILVAIVIAVGPLATIFAINTLFSTGIAYNFWTWISVVILNVNIIGAIKAKKG